jgi:hypothetical protein
MMAKCMDFHSRGAPQQRGQQSLTRLAVAAIFIGVLAIELVAIGASLPAMLPQDTGTGVHSTR